MVRQKNADNGASGREDPLQIPDELVGVPQPDVEQLQEFYVAYGSGKAEPTPVWELTNSALISSGEGAIHEGPTCKEVTSASLRLVQAPKGFATPMLHGKAYTPTFKIRLHVEYSTSQHIAKAIKLESDALAESSISNLGHWQPPIHPSSELDNCTTTRVLSLSPTQSSASIDFELPELSFKKSSRMQKRFLVFYAKFNGDWLLLHYKLPTVIVSRRNDQYWKANQILQEFASTMKLSNGGSLEQDGEKNKQGDGGGSGDGVSSNEEPMTLKTLKTWIQNMYLCQGFKKQLSAQDIDRLVQQATVGIRLDSQEGENVVLPAKQVDTFTAWFKKVLKLLKLNQPWEQSGMEPSSVICLSLDRVKAEEALQQQEVGTFLLRLSSEGGCLVISIKVPDGPIAHYLIDSVDIFNWCLSQWVNSNFPTARIFLDVDTMKTFDKAEVFSPEALQKRRAAIQAASLMTPPTTPSPLAHISRHDLTPDGVPGKDTSGKEAGGPSCSADGKTCAQQSGDGAAAQKIDDPLHYGTLRVRVNDTGADGGSAGGKSGWNGPVKRKWGLADEGYNPEKLPPIRQEYVPSEPHGDVGGMQVDGVFSGQGGMGMDVRIGGYGSLERGGNVRGMGMMDPADMYPGYNSNALGRGPNDGPGSMYLQSSPPQGAHAHYRSPMMEAQGVSAQFGGRSSMNAPMQKSPDVMHNTMGSHMAHNPRFGIPQTESQSDLPCGMQTSGMGHKYQAQYTSYQRPPYMMPDAGNPPVSGMHSQSYGPTSQHNALREVEDPPRMNPAPGVAPKQFGREERLGQRYGMYESPSGAMRRDEELWSAGHVDDMYAGGRGYSEQYPRVMGDDRYYDGGYGSRQRDMGGMMGGRGMYGVHSHAGMMDTAAPEPGRSTRPRLNDSYPGGHAGSGMATGGEYMGMGMGGQDAGRMTMGSSNFDRHTSGMTTPPRDGWMGSGPGPMAAQPLAMMAGTMSSDIQSMQGSGSDVGLGGYGGNSPTSATPYGSAQRSASLWPKAEAGQYQ